MTIDYTKLNDRIVEQAYSYVLSKDEKRKLIDEKLDRAVRYYKSLKTPVYTNKDQTKQLNCSIMCYGKRDPGLHVKHGPNGRTLG